MILVTGGTGFVGAAAVRELARRGKPVAVLSRDVAKVTRRFPGLGIEARQGDVSHPAGLRAAFAGIDAVIDCVQFPNSPIENRRKGWTFEQVDYQGTVNQVAAACNQSHCNKVVCLITTAFTVLPTLSRFALMRHMLCHCVTIAAFQTRS